MWGLAARRHLQRVLVAADVLAPPPALGMGEEWRGETFQTDHQLHRITCSLHAVCIIIVSVRLLTPVPRITEIGEEIARVE